MQEQIISFSKAGMHRLLELQVAEGGDELVVRMGVRDGNSASQNGEYSYRMEPTTAAAVKEEDAEVLAQRGRLTATATATATATVTARQRRR